MRSQELREITRRRGLHIDLPAGRYHRCTEQLVGLRGPPPHQSRHQPPGHTIDAQQRAGNQQRQHDTHDRQPTGQPMGVASKEHPRHERNHNDQCQEHGRHVGRRVVDFSGLDPQQHNAGQLSRRRPTSRSRYGLCAGDVLQFDPRDCRAIDPTSAGDSTSGPSGPLNHDQPHCRPAAIIRTPAVSTVVGGIGSCCSPC